MRTVLAILLTFLVAVGVAFSADHGSKEQAQAMTEKAVKYYERNGRDLAFRAFNNGYDGFKDRDLYVFVYDQNGTCVSHGSNPAMIGKNLLLLKDVDGKELIRHIVSIETSGWVDYKWGNPVTRDIQRKSAYIIHSGKFWFGVGYYQSSPTME